MQDTKPTQFLSPKRIFSFCFFVCMALFSVSHVQAATLSMSATQSHVTVGQTVRYRVFVNTQSAAINAVEGVITFDPTMVEVISVSTVNSILGIWIEEPRYSNISGTISFGGGVISPGYTGASGEIFSVLVKAKKDGSTGFKIKDVSVRENDGTGADVFSGTSNLTNSMLVIQSTKQVPQMNTTIVAAKPAAESTVVKNNTTPSTPVVSPSFGIQKITDLSDVIVAINSNVLEISVQKENLDHAEVVIAGTNTPPVPFVNGKVAVAIPQGVPVGSNVVQVVLFDKAGNKSGIQTIVQVPDTSKISIILDSKKVVVGDSVFIYGHTSLANSTVRLNVKTPQLEVKQFETQADHNGEFVFRKDILLEGKYVIWAENPTGLKSAEIEFQSRSSVIQTVDNFILKYHVFIRIIIGILIIALLYSFLKSLKKPRKDKLTPDMAAVETKLQNNLKTLKFNAQEELVYLDELSKIRELSHEEKDLRTRCLELLK